MVVMLLYPRSCPTCSRYYRKTLPFPRGFSPYDRSAHSYSAFKVLRPLRKDRIEFLCLYCDTKTYTPNQQRSYILLNTSGAEKLSADAGIVRRLDCQGVAGGKQRLSISLITQYKQRSPKLFSFSKAVYHFVTRSATPQ